PPNKGRGFAGLQAEQQRQISSLGGQAAHARGRAHKFSRAEAIAGGQKGGRSVSKNRAHMSAIGRRGGLAGRREQRPDEAEPPEPAEAAPPKAAKSPAAHKKSDDPPARPRPHGKSQGNSKK